MKMRFFADEMLGKMARWLRMMGLDVLYERSIADDRLIRVARQEQRVILTRDTRLIKRLKKEEYFFISEDYLDDQIKEFFLRFPEIKQNPQPFSRCVECNTPLELIEKEKVQGKVWPYVFQTQNQFTSCPSCQRIYWKATHVKEIQARLDRMLNFPSSS